MESTRRPSLLIRLGKLANSQKFDEMEEVWLVAVDDPGLDPADLIPIAGQVGRLGEGDKAESLLWVLISSLEERSGPSQALAAARLAVSELPVSDGLRQEVIRLYAAVHTAYPELGSLLDRLFRPEVPVDQAVALTDAYLRLQPGAFFSDRNQLQPGLIERVDGRTALITARFDQRHQEYGPDAVGQLESLPADHFPALLLYAPDRLRQLALEQPQEYVLLALRSAKDNSLAYRELKRTLALVLGEKEWPNWWKKARESLRRSPNLELSAGSQPTLRLLKVQRSFEDRLRAEYDALADSTERLVMILSYLDKQVAQEAAEPRMDLLVHFGNSAAKLAVASLAEDPVLALAALAVHAEVAACGVAVARPHPRAAVQVSGRIADPGLLGQLPEPLLLRTLHYVRSTLIEQWPDIWSTVLLKASRRVCDVLARGLIDAGRRVELGNALGQVLERPTAFPEALCWLWRVQQTSTLGPVLDEFPFLTSQNVLTALLNLADTTGRMLIVSADEKHRKALDMAQQSLAAQGGAQVREVFAGLGAAEAAQFKQKIVDNNGLTSLGRGQLLGLLRAVHPALFLEDSKPWLEQQVIYTTDRGLRRRQAEFDRIITVDIPAVAKQIGEAAAFGDLSENSEFTAALEKRDQLTSRATGMEKELKAAQIITPEMVGSHYVNIGCRVQVRNETHGGEETYTFLGPWDADPEQGILTYNAPVALAFMGKKAGDEVVYGKGSEERRWTILAIEPAF